MKKLLLILFMLIISITVKAQKWAYRFSFNMMYSYCAADVLKMDSKEGHTIVTGQGSQRRIRTFRGGYRDIKTPTPVFDHSIIKSLTEKKSLIIGYRYMQPDISSAVLHTFPGSRFASTYGHSEGIGIYGPKINYAYAFKKQSKVNPSSFSIYSGILFCFSSKVTGLGNGNWGGSSGYIDSSGNTVITEYTYVSRKSSWRSKWPIPYLNAGIEGGLRIGKRFKIGLNLEAIVGPKTLYTQTNLGTTEDATFEYKIKLKPYFFSGGIYFQYRIK